MIYKQKYVNRKLFQSHIYKQHTSIYSNKNTFFPFVDMRVSKTSLALYYVPTLGSGLTTL